MRIKLYLLFLNLVILFSCKKAEQANPVDTTGTESNDIYVVEFVPDKKLTTVSSWYQAPNPYGGSFTLPTPSDSSCKLEIPLGPVISKKIMISLSHYYWFTSPGSGLGNYNFQAALYGSDPMISFTGSTKQTAGVEFPFKSPTYIPKDSLISNQQSYYPQSTLYTHGNHVSIHYYGEFGEKYIGFRVYNGTINREHAFYYGWILLSRSETAEVTIKALAINQICNKPIRAGQKQ